jgi:predicted ATP-grasp superfamily ATP-dependent carboligase
MINVLVLSGTASAINYINSLAGQPDVSLHVTDSNPYCPGLYAPGVTPHVLPRARDSQRYRTELDGLLSENHIDVLIPTSDYDVEGVVHYLNDGWQPSVSLFKPTFGSFDTLSHKGRLMARLSEVMPAVVPRTWGPDAEPAALRYPVVVKPTGESGGRGVAIVNDATDLAAAAARLRALVEDRFVIQEFIPGRTYVATMVYDREGRLVIGVGMRSHLTFFTWGGGGCAGEMVDEPEMLRLTEQVVEASGGWRGPINFEWRRRADTGAFYLMEANCRLNGYSYLTTMNGVCLPRVVLSLLTDAPLPAVTPPPSWRTNFILGFRETIVDRWVQAVV